MSQSATLPARTARLWQRRPATHRLGQFGIDVAIILTVMALYFLARGYAPTRIDASVSLSLHLINLEQALGIFYEPAIQRFSIENGLVKEAANFTYAYLHFPVMALVGVWLWWRGRDRFMFMRNVMFVSMGIGVAFYYLLPAAPPRLMALNGYDFGFIDTVFGGNTSVNYAQPSLIVNEYAAIPSFHFGWIALSAAAVWINTSNRVLRGLAVGLVVLMTWAIVATANHYFVDMALGGLVILASWRIARIITSSAPMTVEPAYAVATVPASTSNRRAA